MRVVRLGLLAAGMILLAASCGSDERTITSEPSGSPFNVVFACYRAHGLDVPDVEFASPSPAGPRFPADVATAAWQACREAHLTTLRDALTDGDETGLPAIADPLAFADCMAGRGWLPQVGSRVEGELLAAYDEANAACGAPVAGASREASYCRVIHARHDDERNPPPFDSGASERHRLEEAVDQYESLRDIAPDELRGEFQEMAEVARNAINEGPGVYGDTIARVLEYNTRVCGAPLSLGPSD